MVGSVKRIFCYEERDPGQVPYGETLSRGGKKRRFEITETAAYTFVAQ